MRHSPFHQYHQKNQHRIFPLYDAQLRHGEVVHVYGTGENSASFFNEEGMEVAPLASLSNGRRRVHVRLPYFGTPDEICGWMTAGSWMVPMKMYQDRPFQLLTAEFTMDRRGYAPFSWDSNDGPFTIGHRLNIGSSLGPAWMLPTIASSAFQLTSALGYLDIVQLVISRCPRQWQPRGRAEDYSLVRDLEEVLLRNGGAWRQHRLREQSGYVQMHFPEFRAIARTNLALARSATILAVQQGDYNHLEDDDLQHLD